MIGELVKGETDKFSEMAKYNLAYVEHLVGYGLVTQRGDDYEFSFAAVEEVVKNTITSIREPVISEKWALISSRRNRIEEEIRAALYHWSTRIGADSWSNAVKKCLTEKRLSEVGPLTRQEAFSKHNSKLYFVELKEFIRYSKLYDDVKGPSGGDIFHAMNLVNLNR